MTSYYPPTTNFPNINFNNDFFAIPNNNQGITLAYANTHYLFSTGVANSSAISTFFSGGVGIGVASGTAGSLNAISINVDELKISNVNVNNIFITSNVLSNVLILYDTITARNDAVALKQDILTSSTALLGDGSAITNLNYNNISNISDFATAKALEMKQDKFDTVERQYPSRIYNTAASFTTTTFLTQNVYTKTLTLNNDGSTYDYGVYTLWWSTNQSGYLVNSLFDFNTTTEFRWNPGGSPNIYALGVYTGSNYILNDYKGDWIVIKLVKEIKLTKFTFFNTAIYMRGAPGKWKIYGSLDGNNWEYIEDASNTLEKVVYSGDAGRSYTKSNIYSTKAYLYFGLVVNEITGATGFSLAFTEWKIYGVEKMSYQADWNTTIINKPTILNTQWTTSGTSIYYNGGNIGIGTISPNHKLEVIGTTKTDALIINNLNFNDIINTTSNAVITIINNTSNEINNKLDVINATTSNLNDSIISTNYMFNSILDSSYCKKSTFLIETNYLITYNNINYYTYTIDLTKYLRYLQISDITKLLRFKINATLASSVGVFSYLTECEYKIMMSQSSSIGQTGGFHCRAFGVPEDLNLTKFDNYKFVKTNNIYQLVYLSPIQYAKFLITIIDEL